MSKNKGHQKGPQQHGEGMQGRKTHNAFIEGRHGRHGGSEESEGAPQDAARSGANVYGIPQPGHNRLFEDREQHDEAEKNSEANRLTLKATRDDVLPDGPSLKGGKRPGSHH
jgi:hypothetical protein